MGIAEDLLALAGRLANPAPEEPEQASLRRSVSTAYSTVQVTLEKGADGARPHRHERLAEMFYVLGGIVQVLSGTEIVKVEQGDVIVAPPGLPHAFSAERGSRAEILILIAPGVERFEYFRQLTRIAQGKEPPESLREVQDLYDTYFLNSPEWEAAHARD